MSIDPSAERSKVCQDNFSYFYSEVLRLLSPDESVLPFDSEPCEKRNGAAGFFDNGTLCNLSDFRKQKLENLLRQAFRACEPDFEETLEPVITMCQLKAVIKSKQAGSDDGASQPVFDSSCSFSKRKRNHQPQSGVDEENEEEEDDMQVLLESDPTLVEEMIKKHCDEHYASLFHMEKQLEGLINAVVSGSRPMIPVEMHKLCNMIKDLPQENLDRVSEIVHQGKPDEELPDETVVHLEKEDHMKLWRLYYFVEAVKKDRKDASGQW
ncbi:hypothetical protein ACFE04_010092 [Oxalis oulophora]